MATSHDIPSAERKWKRAELWAKSRICGICNKELPGIDRCTIDHIVPVSRGGTNDLSNLQLTHNKCNNVKGNMMGFTWYRKHEKRRFVYHGTLIDSINLELYRTSRKKLIMKYV